MMKFFIRVGLVVSMLGCFSLEALNMKNEPKEVHGLKFNTPFAEIPDMKSENGRYFKEKEKLLVFDVPVKSVLYKFHDNRLYEITFLFEGLYNFNSLKSVLFNKHGLSTGATAQHLSFWTGNTPTLPQNKEVWYGKNTYILLEYNSGEGILTYQYLPILKKMYK